VVKLKNIFVGFLVSFIGSIPLGYLNVVGFDIYAQKGMQSTIWYLLGVICIEFIVIFFTLIFAKKLAENKKLTKFIEGFSIFFMFILAIVFYSGSNSESSSRTVFSNISQNYFFAGLLLSSLNFIQIPFWTGWNLYLLNGNYIEVSKSRKYFYVLGTIAGTFSGMLMLILSLNYFASNVDFLSKYLMKFIIPTVFLGLGIFQGYKFYRKYFH
jgi:threonine/homoserine/homoserine lactone efflux protein